MVLFGMEEGLGGRLKGKVMVQTVGLLCHRGQTFKHILGSGWRLFFPLFITPTAWPQQHGPNSMGLTSFKQ